MALKIRVSVKKPKQYYMHKEDADILGRLRNCASNPTGETNGCPAVWVLNEPVLKTKITKYWQIYLCAMNPGITPKQVMNELGCTRAIANKTGFGCSTPRRNYITGEDKDAADPLFDKDRTMSRAMVMSLDGKEYDEDFIFQGDVRRGYIVLKTFNGNGPPPMKPGKRQPETLAEARFDDYLYNPRDDWEMFFALNIVNTSGRLIPFAGGALYPWFFNGTKPVCFFPHVSRETIKYLLGNLNKLPLETPRINPYTK